MVKFFFEDPSILLKDVRLIPNRDPEVSIEEQMNCLSRVVIVIFFILYFTSSVSYDQSVLFLLLSLFLIIILYYYTKSNRLHNMQKYIEPYTDMSSSRVLRTIKEKTQLGPDNNYSFPKLEAILRDQRDRSTVDRTIKQRYTVKPLSSDSTTGGPSAFVKAIRTEKVVLPNPLFRSKNQALVGGANPKTLIPPVVVPSIRDFNHWKDGNDFSIPQQINRRAAQDFYASGYYTDEPACRDQRQPDSRSENKNYSMYPSEEIRGGYTMNDFPLTEGTLTKRVTPIDTTEGSVENYTELDLKRSRVGGGYDQYEKTSSHADKEYCKYTNVRYIDDFVDNPTNTRYNLPINYNSAPYQLQKSEQDYNNELFMSDVSGGSDTYYKTRYVEPLSSTIGISYTQQIPQPPRESEPSYQEQTERYGLGPQDVYDPRFTGYGSSNRVYNEKMTGQPRFTYQDVDSIRQPNFIARTNVDFLKDSMTYGPMLSAEDTVYCNDTMRERVEGAYLDNQIGFRNEMMGRLLRPKNVQGWQTKTMPNHTRPQFTLGARKI